MKYANESMRRLISIEAILLFALLGAQSAAAQCVTTELKEQWRAGDYQQVLHPLLDCYKKRPLGVSVLEIEYMLAKTLCRLPRQKANGCSAYSSLKFERGRYINVFGYRVDLDSDACCHLPDVTVASSPTEGVGVSQQFIRIPFEALVSDVQEEISKEAGAGERATTLVARYSQITSMLSGKCLDIMYGGTQNGALLLQFDCNNQANQSWRFAKREDGYYNIIVKHSGKCLDVNGSSHDNGVEIFQYDCHDGDNQRWRVLRSQEGYLIVAKHSSKCLDVNGGNLENMAHIVQWDCHGGPNQRWAIPTEMIAPAVIVGPPRATRPANPGTEKRVAPPPPQRLRTGVPLQL